MPSFDWYVVQTEGASQVADSVVSRLVWLGSDTDWEELEAFGHGAV